MRYSLFVGSLLAGIATAGSATARDNFKTGSTAYSVGLYGSAARHWLALAEKETRLSSTMWDECCITNKACAATRLKPINGS